MELDPNLANAYMNLAGIYYDSGETSSMMPYATKAFALRERLSQRSRWFDEAVYYSQTGELDKAKATYIQWQQTFPADVTPHQNLPSCLATLGQLEQATMEAREAVRLLPNIPTYNNLAEQLLFTNRLEEAKVVFEEAKARGIDNLLLRQERYLLAFLQGDNAAMQEQLSWAMATPEGKAWALLQPGNIAIYHGRFRVAQNLYSVAQSYSHWSAANPPDEVLVHTVLGYAETGNPVRARQAAEQAVSAGSNGTSKQLVALIFARAGAVDEAESIAKSSQGREAAAEFQKMVDHPGILQDLITASLCHLQLGRAQAMMGDKAAARKSYQDFLRIWKDADRDIPIYKQAKAEYARLQ